MAAFNFDVLYLGFSQLLVCPGAAGPECRAQTCRSAPSRPPSLLVPLTALLASLPSAFLLSFSWTCCFSLPWPKVTGNCGDVLSGFKFHSDPDRRKVVTCLRVAKLSYCFVILRMVLCFFPAAWRNPLISGGYLVVLGGLTLMREDPGGGEEPTCLGDSPRVNPPALGLWSEQSVFKVSG